MFILTNDVPHCNNEEPFDKEKYLFAKLCSLSSLVLKLYVMLCISFKMKQA